MSVLFGRSNAFKILGWFLVILIAQMYCQIVLADVDLNNQNYIGAAACGECHSKQWNDWQGSHHEQAMKLATEGTVLGDFNNRSFVYFGIKSKFFREKDKFYISTDGADGKISRFKIAYTFGVYPLQQYLIEFPNGRLQALGIAWDTRDKKKGGQRWFHLYPKDNVKAGESIHWTGIDQNWNHMCAECHSTNLQKNFNFEQKKYNTTWSEINVACEACHGPGRDHASWARQSPDIRAGSADDGLVVKLTSSTRTSWRKSPDDLVAKPDYLDNAHTTVDLCGRCHSRRSPVSEKFNWGGSLLNSHIPELLTSGKYYPDGTMQDEVYNYGSFLQSKMYRAGVSCNDCHEPHSLKLRANGNAVCNQCHLASHYDNPKHHFHALEGAGSSCIDCHMAASTYLGVDRRHDHGFRLPRPDLTKQYQIPNACNDCHVDKTPAWAIDALIQHYGHSPQGFQNYAKILADARTIKDDALSGLTLLAADKSASAIARASALWELRNFNAVEGSQSLQLALNDPEPLVRLGAVEAIVDSTPLRKLFLLDVIDDPILSIRTLAAKGLAGVPADQYSVATREKIQQVTREYVATQKLNADRPESHMNLGAFYEESGNLKEAENSYMDALFINDAYVPAVLNLYEFYVSQARIDDSHRVLREAIIKLPADPLLYHTLGLALVREKRLSEALVALKKASQLGGGNARYIYVYAVALNSAGKTEKAIKTLTLLYRKGHQDEEILAALTLWNRTAHRYVIALQYAEELLKLRPDDLAVKGVVNDLKALTLKKRF